VAIINEAGARRLWGGANIALGRRVRLGSTGATAEIVGIVPNARFRDLTTDITAGGAEPDVFFPYAQRTDRDIAIAVRAATGAAVTVGALQQAVAELDAGLPVYAVRTLEDAVAQQTATSRFGSALLTIFSAGALLLAAIGLYGLISYVIGLSRREIAVRMALGADVRRIVLLVVRNGLALVGIGVALGVIGALIAGRALRTQLFETEPMDPAVYAAVAALLVAVAAIATLVPARGAARVNPQTALRAE
jgi:ABC-type antimicrobial peptide transport system permease subunit